VQQAWNIIKEAKNISVAKGKKVVHFSQITDEKEAVSSVLNGVIGDYLEKTENPLEINMQFRHQAKAIPLDKESLEKTYTAPNGKILLMVHGSCMNDIQWTRKEHNHGRALAKEFDKTPIDLHYNSGRHISTNGQNFNELLENLVSHWPVAVEELVIIGHSMGGLVSRSALYYGQQQQNSWTKHLKKIIFLGTPHHGAPMEQAGNYVDVILEAVPYAKPFARLGKIRSAGVTDLRYGNLLDEDWKNSDRFKMHGDQRQHISLPKQIECYAIAGVIGKAIKSGTRELLGDNMVGIKSALGQHKDPTKDLNFKKANTWIAYENNHMDLLSNPKVYNKIKTWML
jgi:pimeloyl-ACP methyl ester carboxylesterase